MTLSRTAAQRSSEAHRASLRPPIARWHREHGYTGPSEPDWDALQAEAEAETFSAVWVALDAHRGDVLVWLADTAYAAIAIDCDGPYCSDDEHRAPCAEASAF